MFWINLLRSVHRSLKRTWYNRFHLKDIGWLFKVSRNGQICVSFTRVKITDDIISTPFSRLSHTIVKSSVTTIAFQFLAAEYISLVYIQHIMNFRRSVAQTESSGSLAVEDGRSHWTGNPILHYRQLWGTRRRHTSSDVLFKNTFYLKMQEFWKSIEML